MGDEFQDWELLHHNPNPESLPPNSAPALIQADYFSLDFDDNESAVSDIPSWIDPENPTCYPNKESTEFLTDSISDRSEDRNQMGFHTNQKYQVGFQGISETVAEKGDQVGIAEALSENCELGSEAIANSDNGQSENRKLGTGHGRRDGIDKKGVAWWKMPMEFLRYFVFRMSPRWKVSVAAAVMGFVVLGRRLYKMKKKKKNTKGLQIKVAVDDKKVSQVMSRAARLNEAFSVVKRAPLTRPALPAFGTATWPAMTIR